MSFEQMASEAKHVYAGVITDVDVKEHDQDGFLMWRNKHYRLTVNVTDVAKTRGKPEKGKNYHNHELSERAMRTHHESLPPHDKNAEGYEEHAEHVFDELHDDETINVGDEVHVHFWRAVSRPPGYRMPDGPGVYGMRNDLVFDEGKKYAFFSEYLHRDHVRRSMYRHTHPGLVKRRRHGAGEDFKFVNAYVAFIPDGVTDDIEGALAAAATVGGGKSDEAAAVDL